jgi:hypothetical protein
MNNRLLILLAAGAALGYFIYSRKTEPKPETEQPKPLSGMGRRIHKPADYQKASIIVGIAATPSRNQKVSNRAKRILDSIKLSGGKKIKVDDKNNIYIGDKPTAQAKKAWEDLVSEQAAILAYRTDDYYPHKPPVFSSLTAAEFRRRFKKDPEDVYKTKWAPKNKNKTGK